MFKLFFFIHPAIFIFIFREVCLFYVDRPGTTCEKWSTTRKKSLRQRSIISCCEFCPDESMFACGSYDGTLGIYDAMNGKVITCAQVSRLGLSQIKFSPDGNRIYCGSRKDGALSCWDMRYMTDPVLSVTRSVVTNQRIYFDYFINSSQQQEVLLCSGSTDGKMHFWSLKEQLTYDTAYGNDAKIGVVDAHSFQAHIDCMNGCSAHPTLPLLLSTSGQRKFPSFFESDDDDTEVDEDYIPEENIVKLWHIPYLDQRNSSVN